ncbi:MAG: methyltransferase domain-containing protein [Salinivirgaceae bacterium]|jgi:2-polyprenyl-3-methyl-5-hydroxy-6-metoxy-1,4-benzoquinol methylase|nr:methyltransferase domain-containing protein [Salinivirgaceae bacterium]
MNTEFDYKKINKRLWNSMVDIHIDSDFYDNESFLKGKNTLNNIELDLLGDLKGKSVLHLQCHFGQDSISLARLGAKVTGVDLSDKAIEAASKFASETNSDAKFICCDVYDTPNYTNEKFDVVFTSYGVISWLPNIDKWAEVIAGLLKPGGKLIFAEFHPIVWMYDDDFSAIKYNYFSGEAIIESEEGTYAEKEANITNKYVVWNHGIGEVVNSLIKNGIEICSLNEFNYSPYNCLKGMIEIAPKKFQIEKFGDKVPLVYSVLGERI